MGYSNDNPTQGSGGTAGKPSWSGGPISTNYDPKAFGQRIGGDISTVYGKGPQTFDKPLYAGLSDTTKGGLASLLGTDTSGLTNGLNGAMDYYSSVARGEQMGVNDPNYNRVRQGVINDTTGAVGSAFTSLGRNASDAHVSTLTNSLADSLAGMDVARLNQDYARRDAATAALPGLYSAMQLPAQTQLGVGQYMDQDAQAKRMAEYDQSQRVNNADYNHLAQYLSLMQGGAQSGVIQQPSNPWLDALGLGVNLAGAFL